MSRNDRLVIVLQRFEVEIPKTVPPLTFSGVMGGLKKITENSTEVVSTYGFLYNQVHRYWQEHNKDFRNEKIQKNL